VRPISHRQTIFSVAGCLFIAIFLMCTQTHPHSFYMQFFNWKGTVSQSPRIQCFRLEKSFCIRTWWRLQSCIKSTTRWETNSFLVTGSWSEMRIARVAACRHPKFCYDFFNRTHSSAAAWATLSNSKFILTPRSVDKCKFVKMRPGVFL
jgi:hypothetical protein